MKCSECRRTFPSSRSDARTCSDKCRQARFRRQHRKAAPPRDLIQEMHPDAITAEQRWQWSAQSLLGDVIAARAFWDRKMPGWRTASTRTIVTLLRQATAELEEIAVALRD